MTVRLHSIAILVLVFLGLPGGLSASSTILIPLADRFDDPMDWTHLGEVLANFAIPNNDLLDDPNLSPADGSLIPCGCIMSGAGSGLDDISIAGETGSSPENSAQDLWFPAGADDIYAEAPDTVPEISRVVITTTPCGKGILNCDSNAFSVDALLFHGGAASVRSAWRPSALFLLLLSLGCASLAVSRRV